MGQLLFVTPSPEYNFFGWALDAVRSDPNDPNSEIVCRATLPGPAFNPLAEGCVPLNLFGIGTADPAALEYAYRTLKEDAKYRQNVIGANFRGTVAEGWAGPIAAASAKALVRNVQAASGPVAIDAANAALIARLRISPEGQEGIAAFLEKRKPRWVSE